MNFLDNNTLFVVIITSIIFIVILVIVFGRKKTIFTLTSKPNQLSASASASLYVVAGPGQGKRIPLGNAPLYIGRLSNNHIPIDAPLVSRKHAGIQFQNGVWLIIDQDSTNGTWVNGQRITEYTLKANDRIQIGPSVLVFQPFGAERTPSPQPFVAPVAPKGPSSTSIARIHALNEYVLEAVGRGGEGVVYRGVARSDGSIVAIKILESQDPYLERKFKQVGEMGKNLRHKHIVAIYHFGQQNESYYIIMEYVDGGSLRERMQTGVPYPIEEAIRILGQTCEALAYAHRQQVIHRDIKPSNILLNSASQVKLSDFGIARILSQPTFTQMGLILGTPEYMSYEQARGQPVSPQSDVYSLGVVAYQLFTGQLPFTSTSTDSWRILDMHLKERPRPPRQMNPSLPPHIESAILRAMEKDINKRFRNSMEFAQALGYRVQQGIPSKPAPINDSYQPSARLIAENGRVIPINRSEIIITRTLLSGHPSVSRSHARIVWQGNQYWLRDEQSTNGTWRNGQRISTDWTPLQSNDTVIFGHVTFRFLADA